MKDIDTKDAPYLAVGMAMSVDGIWSDDNHFRKQNVLRTYSTKDMVIVLEKWDPVSLHRADLEVG